MLYSISTAFAAALLLLTSTTSALPQGKIDSAMPFLSSTSASVMEAVAAETTTSATASATISATTSSVTPTLSGMATTSTSYSYENPFTIYTTMTNSLGVITGMPQVDTSIPTQAPVATICSGCSSVLSDQSSWASMVASMYSTSVTPVQASATSTESSSPTVSIAQHTGAASRHNVLGGGLIVAILAAFL